MTTKNQRAFEALAIALREHTLFQTTEFQRPNVRAHWGPSLQESIAQFMDHGMARFVVDHGQKVADDYVKGLQLLQSVDEVVAAAKVKHSLAMKNAMRNFVREYFSDNDEIELSISGLNVTISDINIVRLGGVHNPQANNSLIYNDAADTLGASIIFQDSVGTFWMGELLVDAAGTWNVKLSGQVDPRHPLITGSDEDMPW